MEERRGFDQRKIDRANEILSAASVLFLASFSLYHFHQRVKENRERSEIMRMADVNKDGIIDDTELRNLYQKTNPSMSYEEFAFKYR